MVKKTFALFPPGNKANEDYEGKESYHSLMSEDWTSFSSNRRRNLQYTRRNLRQLLLETSNQFAPLTNLNKDSEFPRYVPSVK